MEFPSEDRGLEGGTMEFPSEDLGLEGGTMEAAGEDMEVYAQRFVDCGAGSSSTITNPFAIKKRRISKVLNSDNPEMAQMSDTVAWGSMRVQTKICSRVNATRIAAASRFAIKRLSGSRATGNPRTNSLFQIKSQLSAPQKTSLTISSPFSPRVQNLSRNA